MTEQEYIDTSNLARVRCAAQIMRDFIEANRPIDKRAVRARIELAGLMVALEKIVAIDPEKPA